MARGRFISNAIMSDKAINQLSNDTSRLAFTWLITIADAEGRTHGDPAMVRSLLFPRRADITLEAMEAYIAEWAEAGLIIWYEASDDKWIWFPNFEKHQIGLRKDRELESIIPPYESGITPECCRSVDGVSPAKIGLSISKSISIREDQDKDQAAPTSSGGLNDLQKTVLSTFGAKRFANKTQAALVAAWDRYPEINVKSACTWAATKGFGLGQAIASIEKALPKWDAPKPNNGKGSSNAIRKQPEYTAADYELADLINADNAKRSAEIAALRDSARSSRA